MALPGQYEVGQLYNDGKINGQVVYTQPGGPGTIVFPQFPSGFPWFGGPPGSGGMYSWPASFPAQYYWGCGHAANEAEVFTYGDPYTGIVMCLICCSMCGYIQQIMPQSQYLSNEQTPLVIA